MSLPQLEIIRPGPQALIQDGGRRGYFRMGITEGGPADRLSFLWANRLCGNRGDTTAIEIVLGNFEAVVSGSARIAVTGADAPLYINGQKVSPWCVHNLRRGSRIRIGAANAGVRIYLAISGGFAVDPVLDSTATVTREHLGGLSGEALKTGDLIPYSVCHGDDRRFFVPPPMRPAPASHQPLRVIAAWRPDRLPKSLRRAFYSGEYTLSKDSSRMGMRLEGKPLPDIDLLPDAMVSEGVIQGTVQITPDGLPIIMHCDHQTIGGYPKLGTVVTPDLWRLAQMPPGTTVHFRPVTPDGAQKIYRQSLRDYESAVPVILGDHTV